jgi:hypothetical protein
MAGSGRFVPTGDVQSDHPAVLYWYELRRQNGFRTKLTTIAVSATIDNHEDTNYSRDSYVAFSVLHFSRIVLVGRLALRHSGFG